MNLAGADDTENFDESIASFDKKGLLNVFAASVITSLSRFSGFELIPPNLRTVWTSSALGTVLLPRTKLTYEAINSN